MNHYGRVDYNKRKIDEFKNYLRLEEKSKNTIEKYLRDINAFWKYVGEQIVTKELAIRYKEHLLSDEYAVRSVNSMIASLNSFFTFVGCEYLKIKTIKEQRQIFCSEDKELTKEEYTRFLNAAENNGNKRLNLILQTICGTGIPSMDEMAVILKDDDINVSVISKTSYQIMYQTLNVTTGGVFADINSDFQTGLLTISNTIDENTNDGYWIALNGLLPQIVKLDERPTPMGLADTDKDGYNDHDDLSPLIPYKTLVILIHGRGDNSESCFGLQNQINTNLNSGYDFSNTNLFTDVMAQSIISNSTGTYASTDSIGKALIDKGYVPNGNLFVFNYPNQDMCYINAALLSRETLI